LSLLNRPCFDRLWIWQQIRLPSGDNIVRCGDQAIRWSSMPGYIPAVQNEFISCKSSFAQNESPFSNSIV
jgi:hypothetical protein